MFRKIFISTLFTSLLVLAQIVSAQSVEEIAAKYYSHAEEVAQKFVELRTFSDHGTHHAILVAKKSAEAADAINAANLGNPYYSLIDQHELQIAAILHDTGMDGGNFKEYPDGNKLRKDHSLNSAIHVLENREAIAALGVNVDAVALDCMCHSKSCSGVRDLTSPEQWTDCFNRIDAAVELYNKKFPNAPIYFDKTTWTNGDTYTNKNGVEVYRLNRETIAQSAATIAALRIGDANRETAQYPYTQTGEKIEVDFDSYTSPAKDWKEEVSKAKIFMVDKNGNRTSMSANGLDKGDFGKMYSAGEGNLSMSCEYDSVTGNICEVFKVFRGESFLLSTMSCIDERLEELDTMKNFPVEARIEILGDYSKLQRKKISRAYNRYCLNATNKHKFPVTIKFEKG